MKEIILNKIQVTSKRYCKYVALVDDADYDYLNQYNWTLFKVKKCYYSSSKINGKYILMHRLIMNAEKGQMIDHIDRNGLNCQRDNMRFCTYSENLKNRSSWGKVKLPKKGFWKLTKEQYQFILTNKDRYKQTELAKMFNVSKQNINYIVLGKQGDKVLNKIQTS